MKKLLFYAAIILCIGTCLSLTFCSTKSKLNDFKLVSYEIQNNEVEISSYSTIDENGVLKVFLKRYSDSAFYKYQLNSDDIKIINKLSSKKLQEFVVKKEFEEGSGYSGSLNYLSFKTQKRNEKLCFILPFMDNQFNEGITLLENKIFSQNDSCRTTKFKIDFEKTKSEILTQAQTDNYLPKKQSLPPPMKR
ncbi:hypothetical protein EGX91_08170 [Chryseobacterium indologenes]|uniref:hypothetical protein n=1 Tax=Chryseobacterium indologenes TaxID=253 RepID=UPI000F507613|nr:hypothetical protein [Chryseobacterium indologenes]AYY84525.1 hypothetical protein EGX91_08170 [Chryseobacterium indologenes]